MTRRTLLFSVLLLATAVPVGATDIEPVSYSIDLGFATTHELVFVVPPFTPPPSTTWRAPLDSSGDWFNADLWTNGVPNAETNTRHVNGSEILLDQGLAEVRSLSLGFAGGGRSRLTQSGGRLELAQGLTISDGVYRQEGGGFEADSLTLSRFDSFFLSAANREGIPLPPTAGNAFVIGAVWPTRLPPLPFTETRYELTGGTATIRSAVNVNASQFNISGGTLNAESFRVDAGRTASLLTDSFLINGVSQSGGAVEVAGELSIQNGTYNLSGGSLSIGALAIGDPLEGAVVSRSVFFPGTANRSPEFLQTGGTLEVMGNLELCVPGFNIGSGTISPPFGILPPIQPFSDVAYRLQAGTVNVAGDTTVGSLGLAPARFVQSGGSFTTAGTLRIEGEESRYEITSGMLRTGVLEVGVEQFNTGGTLAIGSAAARVLVEDRVTLGAEAVIEAAPGATIELDGGAFEVLGPVAARLAGLENTSLVITGNGELSTLEAASVDVGDLVGGFENNFGWGELRVGDADQTGSLLLVDAVDNAAATTPEAVYVDTLFVGAGSTLDLGGLNLYYREAVVLGDVLASGGKLLGVAAPVPEPAAVVLLALTVGFSAVVRRQG